MEHAVANSTYKGYNSAISQYLNFCDQFGLLPFPVHELILVYYVAIRSLSVKHKTVFRDLYAIKYFSQASKLDSSNLRFICLP